MKRFVFALTPLVVGTSPHLLADITGAALDDVVVTASRTESSTFEVIPATTVIRRDQIDRSPGRDIGDLLRQYAGLQVARSGGLGAQTSVFIRGANSNHTLFMVDGVPITNGVTGGALIQNLPLGNIERIEVVRGPQSTLYGSEAIGGVINIITRQADRSGGDYRITAGNNGLAEGSLSLQHRRNNRGALITLEKTRFDGVPAFLDAEKDLGYKRDSFSANAYHQWQSLRVDISHRLSKGLTEYVGPSFSGFPLLDQDLEQENTRIGLTHTLSANTSWQMTLSRNNERILQNQSSDFVITRQDQADLQANIQAGRHRLVTGLTLARLDIKNETAFGNYFDNPKTHAFFVQDTWEMSHWTLMAGLRSQRDDRFGGVQTGSFGISYQFKLNTRLYTSLGTGYKTPDGQNLAFNPLLAPEQSRNVEMGLRHQGPSRQWHFAAFANDIRDLIGFDDSFDVRNIDRARIEGLETTWRENFGAYTLYANSTLLRARDLSSGEDLSRRPRRSGTVGAEWRQEKTSSFVEAKARSKTDNSSFDSFKLPGYAVVNIGTRYILNSKTELAIAVDNLFDVQHSEAQTGPRRFTAQPRQLKVSLQSAF